MCLILVLAIVVFVMINLHFKDHYLDLGTQQHFYRRTVFGWGKHKNYSKHLSHSVLYTASHFPVTTSGSNVVINKRGKKIWQKKNMTLKFHLLKSPNSFSEKHIFCHIHTSDRPITLKVAVCCT